MKSIQHVKLLNYKKHEGMGDRHSCHPQQFTQGHLLTLPGRMTGRKTSTVSAISLSSLFHYLGPASVWSCITDTHIHTYNGTLLYKRVVTFGCNSALAPTAFLFIFPKEELERRKKGETWAEYYTLEQGTMTDHMKYVRRDFPFDIWENSAGVKICTISLHYPAMFSSSQDGKM